LPVLDNPDLQRLALIGIDLNQDLELSVQILYLSPASLGMCSLLLERFGGMRWIQDISNAVACCVELRLRFFPK
jgi:hypothetical protein